MISDGNNGMVMPVGPMYGAGYGGGNGALGGDWSSWILLFLIAMMFGNNGWGNNGNSGANGQFPWLLASGQRTDDNVQAGFNQAATAGQLSSIQNSINSGFANAEVANCNRALTDLQANYQAQLNNLNGLNNVSMGLQNCCCLLSFRQVVLTEMLFSTLFVMFLLLSRQVSSLLRISCALTRLMQRMKRLLNFSSSLTLLISCLLRMHRQLLFRLAKEH